MIITVDQWGEALEHCRLMMGEASRLPGGTGAFYVSGCKLMIKRFLDGERTSELYAEMMELH